MTLALPNLQTRRDFIRTMAAALPVLAAGPALASATPRTLIADQRFAANGLVLRKRHHWTDVQPNPNRLRVATPKAYDRITLHHAGTQVVTLTSEPAVASCLDGILAGHMKRGFGDIGYHYLVDYAGRVWEGRSLQYWGAHVSGQNDQNIGIVLIGNFEEQRPSRAQLQTMGKLVGLVRQRFGIPEGRIYGHIDLGQTLCPGRHLYPRVRMLNQLA